MNRLHTQPLRSPVWDAIRVESQTEDLPVSLFRRLRDAVAGNGYLDEFDGDYDDLEGYDADGIESAAPRSSPAPITRGDMPSFGRIPSPAPM